MKNLTCSGQAPLQKPSCTCAVTSTSSSSPRTPCPRSHPPWVRYLTTRCPIPSGSSLLTNGRDSCVRSHRWWPRPIHAKRLTLLHHFNFPRPLLFSFALKLFMHFSGLLFPDNQGLLWPGRDSSRDAPRPATTVRTARPTTSSSSLSALAPPPSRGRRAPSSLLGPGDRAVPAEREPRLCRVVSGLLVLRGNELPQGCCLSVIPFVN
jgi:hypothetical protein